MLPPAILSTKAARALAWASLSEGMMAWLMGVTAAGAITWAGGATGWTGATGCTGAGATGWTGTGSGAGVLSGGITPVLLDAGGTLTSDIFSNKAARAAAWAGLSSACTMPATLAQSAVPHTNGINLEICIMFSYAKLWTEATAFPRSLSEKWGWPAGPTQAQQNPWRHPPWVYRDSGWAWYCRRQRKGSGLASRDRKRMPLTSRRGILTRRCNSTMSAWRSF